MNSTSILIFLAGIGFVITGFGIRKNKPTSNWKIFIYFGGFMMLCSILSFFKLIVL
jgi:hypothetical protein